MFGGGLDALESLNVSGINLTDNCIIAAVNYNKNLKILRVSNCNGLTSYIIDILMSTDIPLFLLEINRSKDIPDSKLEELVIRYT